MLCASLSIYLFVQLAHLADLESQKEMLRYFPLYEAGLMELKYNNVPFRSLRYDLYHLSLYKVLVRWVVGSILHGVDQLSYFSFQPVLHYWCNKGCGMCYPVCGIVYIKEPLLLIGKSSLCGCSGFFTIRMVLNHMSDAI